MTAPVFAEMSSTRYRPLADYGAIGDGRTVALVGRDGSIDWWCPGRFDAPSVFAAVLDAAKGGTFRVAPVDDAASVSRYVPDTNVLDTIHTTSAGAVRVVDFTPPPDVTGVDNSVIVRRVTGLWGSVELLVHFAPRFQYATRAPRFYDAPHGLLARGGGAIMLVTGVDLATRGPGSRSARVTVREGETLDIVLRHRPFDTPVPFAKDLALSPREMEERVVARDQAWSRQTQFEGRDARHVRRAALTLKLLQHEPTGAIVAAPTASLPEAVGGVRNWDYRFAWVRDGALSARALFDVGHKTEATQFRGWLSRVIPDVDEMRIMYTVSGSTDLPESVLPHLEGYLKSSPVRIGNEAVTQRQLDVYGELVDFLHETRDGARLDDETWRLVRATAEWVMKHWREPDSGIWEMRAEPRHFVLSKAMAWAALARAADAARERGLRDDAQRWDREAEVIRAEVLEVGIDDETGGFAQAYGMHVPDASNLLLPLIGFIGADDPRMVATVNEVVRQLTVDGLVYRYLDAHDGIAGTEATFTYCTFWLVEVLAKQKRVAEARALFDGLVARATPLGLFAEEIEPFTGEHLGNYPQGFPHAGLIAAARALQAAEPESDAA